MLFEKITSAIILTSLTAITFLMKNRLTTLLLLFVCVAAFGQKAKLTRADKLFKDLNFVEASKAYLDILDKRDNSEAKKKLAECYRKMNNLKEQEYWLGQVVLLPEAEPQEILYYAMSLQANGKCDQAKSWFDKYTALVPDDMRGRLMAKACDKTVQTALLEEGALYQVKHLEKINTSVDDFGPAFYKDGVVFSSERDKGSAVVRIHAWTGRPFLDLFYTKATLMDEQNREFSYSKPDKIFNEINTKFHDGPIVFTKDFNEIFFTRNNIIHGKVGRDQEGIIGLKIFQAKIENGKIGEPKGMPFNSDEYSVAHPALNNDATKLYFSSNLPGGFGGMDLYVSYLENGRWAPPVNLGPTINTEGSEVFPSMHEDGTLYFASDGHTGLGKLDIFATKELGGTWSTPANLGYPLNSINDDFHLIFSADKTHGYFTSDREGGIGRDDIYSFTKFAVEAEVLVFDKRTGAPIQGATVTTECLKGKTLSTGADGKVKVELPLDRSCNFTANKNLYTENSVNTATKGQTAGSKILVQIPLIKPLEFVVKGRAIDEKTGQPLAGSSITLESDCGDLQQTVRADENGNYSFKLREDCNYVVKAGKDNYLTGTGFINTKDMTESKEFNIDVPLKSFVDTTNTSLAFLLEHIYYDFNKSNIRQDASQSLVDLLNILKNNPDIVVEIGSHTDSRGSDKYNDRLSQRRAESVVKYLSTNGISRDRLQFKGYGEKTHVNNCYDNIPCSEDDHQRNRRTEFKVLGTINGKKFEQGVNSVAPSQIKVDRCNGCPF